MEITQEQFNEAVLIVTGGVEWEVIKQGLANDIYQTQATALDAKTWDQVCEARGFAQGLAYIINLRENTKAVMFQEAKNANL